MQREVMSVVEVAEYLGISESIVRRLVREARIPYNRIEGRILFYLPVLRQWLIDTTRVAVQPVTDRRKQIHEKIDITWNNFKGA